VSAAMPRRADFPSRADFLTPAHGAANVLQVLAGHAALFLWLWLAHAWLPLGVYLPLAVFGCLVHQRAMSEWVHEGGHFNLVADRGWNDRLTDLLVGSVIGVTAEAYRGTHFPHHARRAFFVAGDPDTDFLAIASRRELRRAVLRDLVGITAVHGFQRFGGGSAAAARLGFYARTAVLHHVALAALFAAGRLDAYAIYYATLLTLYPLHNRLRVYGQHVTLEADGRSLVEKSGTSRTIDAGLFDRVFWTSPRLLYHHEHHQHPYLPWRALAGLCAHADDDPNRYARRRWPVLRAIYRGLAPG